jgi:hypothetical protein
VDTNVLIFGDGPLQLTRKPIFCNTPIVSFSISQKENYCFKMMFITGVSIAVTLLVDFIMEWTHVAQEGIAQLIEQLWTIFTYGS